MTDSVGGRSLDVWIFQTGEPLPCDGSGWRPMRAMNLADQMVRRGHKVIIWSAAFFHQEKCHRSGSYKRIIINDSLEIRLIPSIGYLGNISLRRLVDHAQLAINLYLTLRKEKHLPDIGFVGYPPIEFAFAAVHWLTRHKIPMLLDVKDQWPDIFINSFGPALKPIARIIFAPYFFLGRRTMYRSTGLCSMTENFLSWARKFAGRESSEADIVVPLSSKLISVSDSVLFEAFEYWETLGVRQGHHRARFVFLGSFSRAFNFNIIRTAAMNSKSLGLDWQFVICGDGGEADNVRALLGHLDNVVLPGWIDSAQILALSKMSLAGLAPYKNTADFQKSVPNKIIDYLSLNLPVVSPLLGEVEKLIQEHNVGLVYDEDNLHSLFDALRLLADNEVLRTEMSLQAKRIYEKILSAEVSYGRLADRLENMVP